MKLPRVSRRLGVDLLLQAQEAVVRTRMARSCVLAAHSGHAASSHGQARTVADYEMRREDLKGLVSQLAEEPLVHIELREEAESLLQENIAWLTSF